MVYDCWHIDGAPQALEVSEFRWLTPQEVCDLPLPPADEEVIERLKSEVVTLARFPIQAHKIYLDDQEATQEWGMYLAQTLFNQLHDNQASPTLRKAFKRLAVYGELGSGKTTCAQGFALGLGVPEDHYVNSPTFSLLQTHPGHLPFHHLDLYRLESEDELEHLGFDELIESGIAYIEWPERGSQLFEEPHIELRFEYDDDPLVGRWVTLQVKGVSIEDQQWALHLLYSSH